MAIANIPAPPNNLNWPATCTIDDLEHQILETMQMHFESEDSSLNELVTDIGQIIQNRLHDRADSEAINLMGILINDTADRYLELLRQWFTSRLGVLKRIIQHVPDATAFELREKIAHIEYVLTQMTDHINLLN